MDKDIDIKVKSCSNCIIKYLRTPSDSKDVFLFVSLCLICKRVLTLRISGSAFCSSCQSIALISTSETRLSSICTFWVNLYPAHKREFLALKLAVTISFMNICTAVSSRLKQIIIGWLISLIRLSWMLLVIDGWLPFLTMTSIWPTEQVRLMKYLRTPSDSKDVFLFEGLCPIWKRALTLRISGSAFCSSCPLSNYNFNLTYRAGKANGDADPLSRIQPETKQMFHDAIKKDISQRIIIRFNLELTAYKYSWNLSVTLVYEPNKVSLLLSNYG
jgi:hypothetical protein